MEKAGMKNVCVDRRNLLAAASATIATAAISSSAGASGETHAGHGYKAASSEVQALIDSSAECQKAGQTCIEHCVQTLKTGDTSLGDCLDRTQEMLVMCTAMGKLASYQSPHLKKVMNVCIDICTDCQKECEKHADKHAECKACAASCENCIKAVRAYLSA